MKASTIDTPFAKPWGVVPDDPVSIYIDDSIHYQVSGKDASTQWSSLFPQNSRHIVQDSSGTQYTVAMYHQLECLDVIRKSFLERNVTETTRDCFNYLQQAILCHADTRMESIRWIGKPHVISVPGYWRCRDWEALYRASEKSNFH